MADQKSSITENTEELLTVGQKLKQLRLAKGFGNYRNFADENGLEPKQYWRLEEDKVDFKYSSLKRLVKIHGLTMTEFFKGVW
ncbi:hypothetical protein GC194_04835 [bacterium]|nr:hypothetical protein [bacterium]